MADVDINNPTKKVKPEDAVGEVRPNYRETIIVDFDSMEPYYDRVLEHIIQLSPYERKMSLLIAKRQRLIAKLKRQKPGSKPFNYKILPEPCLPDFPANFPFEGTLLDKPKIRIETSFPVTEDFVNEQLMKSVKRILSSLFCNVNDLEAEPLWVLTYHLREFLESFVGLLCKVNVSGPKRTSDNLWDPLETVLQRMRFGGINGLYEFYLENVILRHERLFNLCLKHKSQYEKLKRNKIVVD